MLTLGFSLIWPLVVVLKICLDRAALDDDFEHDFDADDDADDDDPPSS